MLKINQHLQLQVACPACTDSYAIPVHVVQESQDLLDEYGPCSGMASFECPASYFASLASHEAITSLEGALRAFERDALRHGTQAVWVGEDVEAALHVPPLERLAMVPALAPELARWENEGGTPSPTAEAQRFTLR